MPAPIQVPAGFREEFDYLCTRIGTTGQEREWMREQVRQDFDTFGVWVQETAAVYRFIDETWFGRMPTPDLCKGYLASLGWFAEDETIFQRLGIVLQVRLCMRVAGLLPLKK